MSDLTKSLWTSPSTPGILPMTKHDYKVATIQFYINDTSHGYYYSLDLAVTAALNVIVILLSSEKFSSNVL